MGSKHSLETDLTKKPTPADIVIDREVKCDREDNTLPPLDTPLCDESDHKSAIFEPNVHISLPTMTPTKMPTLPPLMTSVDCDCDAQTTTTTDNNSLSTSPAPRIVFLSLFEFWRVWKDIPFNVLFNSICIFNSKRNHILGDTIGNQCDPQCICKHITISDTFRSVLLNKEAQGLVIWVDSSLQPTQDWVLNRISSIENLDLTKIQSADPRWLQIITALNTITDPLATTTPPSPQSSLSPSMTSTIDTNPTMPSNYDTLNLNPQWWQQRYQQLCGNLDAIASDDDDGWISDEWTSLIDNDTYDDDDDDNDDTSLISSQWDKLLSNLTQFEFCNSERKICRDIRKFKYRFSTLSEIIHQSCPTLIPMVCFDLDKYETKSKALQYYVTLKQRQMESSTNVSSFTTLNSISTIQRNTDSNISIFDHNSGVDDSVGMPKFQPRMRLHLGDVINDSITTQLDGDYDDSGSDLPPLPPMQSFFSPPPQPLIDKLRQYRITIEKRDTDRFHYLIY